MVMAWLLPTGSSHCEQNSLRPALWPHAEGQSGPLQTDTQSLPGAPSLSEEPQKFPLGQTKESPDQGVLGLEVMSPEPPHSQTQDKYALTPDLSPQASQEGGGMQAGIAQGSSPKGRRGEGHRPVKPWSGAGLPVTAHSPGCKPQAEACVIRPAEGPAWGWWRAGEGRGQQAEARLPARPGVLLPTSPCSCQQLSRRRPVIAWSPLGSSTQSSTWWMDTV